ncbi:MAG TPA: hypothetical protein PKJ62_07355 [Bacteroidia bacterium]|nr:hypothetical protein [Bacteroidia bacterium]
MSTITVRILLEDKQGNPIKRAKISFPDIDGYHPAFTNAYGSAMIRCTSANGKTLERLYIDGRNYGEVDLEDGAVVKMRL